MMPGKYVGTLEARQWLWIALCGATLVIGIIFLTMIAPPTSPLPSDEKVVVVVDTQGSHLSVSERGSGSVDTYKVKAAEDTVILKAVQPGDIVSFSSNQDKTLSNIKMVRIVIGPWRAAGALLVAFSIIWAAILVITKAYPWGFALGIDRRLSNSQTQIYLWSLVLATVYFAELVTRFWFTDFVGGIGVPSRLLALSGISALSFGAARAITTAKVAADPQAAFAKAPPPVGRPWWKLFMDLFTNDQQQLDLGDFQMIALTFVAILVYVITAWNWLKILPFTSHVDLPPLDDTLLGGTAVSHGAYLLKKLGSKLGN